MIALSNEGVLTSCADDGSNCTWWALAAAITAKNPKITNFIWKFNQIWSLSRNHTFSCLGNHLNNSFSSHWMALDRSTIGSKLTWHSHQTFAIYNRKRHCMGIASRLRKMLLLLIIETRSETTNTHTSKHLAIVPTPEEQHFSTPVNRRAIRSSFDEKRSITLFHVIVNRKPDRIVDDPTHVLYRH